jgi:drug/metabolite transporter (DMT)-like permease
MQGITMPNISDNTNRGYLTALISALFLSLTSIFISYLNINFQLPALILAFWREFFVAFILAVWFIIFRPALLKGAKAHLGYLAVYGFILAMFNALWTISVILNGAAVGTVLCYCSAAFTALLGWLILHEELTLPKIVAVILSLTGCALIVNAFNAEVWRVNPIGIFTGISAGLFYAAYTLMGRSASQRGLNTWTSMLYTFLTAAVFMLFFNLVLGKILPGAATKPADMFWLGKSVAGWIILFTLAVGPTLMGYGLYNVSLKYLPSSIVNLIVTIEPAFTAVVAYFVLGERYTLNQILGSLMVMLGVVVIRVYKNKVQS